MSDDGKNTNDEKPTGGGKVCWITIYSWVNIYFLIIFQLESLSQDDLLKLVKNQFLLKKKNEAKLSELTTANVSLCQDAEVII